MIKTLVITLGVTGLLLGQTFEYVGSRKCGMCHKKEASGAQLKVWEDSKHSKAFETLKSEEAIAIAKEKGLANDPWEAPECIKCHTTGFGKGGYEVKEEAFWNPAADDRDGKKAVKRMTGLQAVGCEMCHGAGSEYKSRKVMKAIYNDETDGAAVGLLAVTEETCLGCHNDESPSFKEFNFEEALAKIAHPFPEGYTPKK
ncbi:MAG: cytochrome C554 [Candidatus Marinimicrobia bacterium]|nr:cytochrome C554 [Candidatus Neomarinimicrobiota bacterium]